MAREFDPYRQWLRLRPEEDLNHYRLLDIPLFEESPAVIQAAAERRKMQVDVFRTGEHAPSAEPLFERISAAARCLLDPEQKAAYDAELRHELRVSAKRACRRRRQMASFVIPIGIGVLLIVGLLITNPWGWGKPSAPPGDPGRNSPATEKRPATND